MHIPDAHRVCANLQVALTAGDPGVVSRHRAEILEVLSLGVDFVFCNLAEAREVSTRGTGQKK